MKVIDTTEFKTETDIQLSTTIGTIDVGNFDERKAIWIILKQDVGLDNDGEYAAFLDVSEAIRLINKLNEQVTLILNSRLIYD